MVIGELGDAMKALKQQQEAAKKAEVVQNKMLALEERKVKALERIVQLLESPKVF